jgi:hypothetical protein
VSGASTQHRWRSWRERFHILRRHFGMADALWSHLQIA